MHGVSIWAFSNHSHTHTGIWVPRPNQIAEWRPQRQQQKPRRFKSVTEMHLLKIVMKICWYVMIVMHSNVFDFIEFKCIQCTGSTGWDQDDYGPDLSMSSPFELYRAVGQVEFLDQMRRRGTAVLPGVQPKEPWRTSTGCQAKYNRHHHMENQADTIDF